MKILVLRNLGAGLPDYREGQTVPDCPDSTAKTLISKGLAQPLGKPTAVKTQPETRLKSEPANDPIELEPNTVATLPNGFRLEQAEDASGEDLLGMQEAGSSEPVDDLENLGKQQLIELAEKRGVSLKNKATKAEILEALRADEPPNES